MLAFVYYKRIGKLPAGLEIFMVGRAEIRNKDRSNQVIIGDGEVNEYS